jgi:hypothetical protein
MSVRKINGVQLKKLGAVIPPPRSKPRGKPTPRNLKPFKKGFDPRRNLKGAPSYVRMGTRLREELSAPAPVEIIKALRLKKGATKYDAVLAAMLHAAMTGDWQCALGLREVIEGRLPNRNFNLTASMEKFLEDPGFRHFLDEQHGAYLSQIGVLDNGTDQLGVPTDSPLSRILGKGTGEGA